VVVAFSPTLAPRQINVLIILLLPMSTTTCITPKPLALPGAPRAPVISTQQNYLFKKRYKKAPSIRIAKEYIQKTLVCKKLHQVGKYMHIYKSKDLLFIITLAGIHSQFL